MADYKGVDVDNATELGMGRMLIAEDDDLAKEIAALTAVASALDSLDTQTRERVLRWANARWGLA